MRTFLLIVLGFVACSSVYVTYPNESDVNLFIVFLGIFTNVFLLAIKLDWVEEDNPNHFLFRGGSENYDRRNSL